MLPHVNDIAAGRHLSAQGARINGKPKLLFFAYYFPPRNGSASVRTWNIAKYLARSGWDVTVVTPDPSTWRNPEMVERVTQEIAREGIHRLASRHRWRCLSPDDLNCWNRNIGWLAGGACRKVARYLGVSNGFGWKSEAADVCSTLSSEDVNVILASGPPFETFELAKRFSKLLGCPYVLDYRDPWMAHSNCLAARRRALLQIEAELLQRSSAVTVVSKSLLKERSRISRKLHVITNGFDPEELAHVKPCNFGHFAIVYTGNFYPPGRVVTPLMKALRYLKEKETLTRREWKFHYYGDHGNHVYEEGHRFNVADHVELHGRVPRTEALSAVRGASVVVVIAGSVDEVTGKIFEPIGMSVPILIIGPSEADVDAIIETAGLGRKFTPSSIQGIATFVLELMSGKTLTASNADAYAWPNIIRRLDLIIRNIMDQSSSSIRNESAE
jgi:glycosyltransferase involved in cell wall biosynthesis